MRFRADVFDEAVSMTGQLYKHVDFYRGDERAEIYPADARQLLETESRYTRVRQEFKRDSLKCTLYKAGVGLLLSASAMISFVKDEAEPMIIGTASALVGAQYVKYRRDVLRRDESVQGFREIEHTHQIAEMLVVTGLASWLQSGPGPDPITLNAINEDLYERLQQITTQDQV